MTLRSVAVGLALIAALAGVLLMARRHRSAVPPDPTVAESASESSGPAGAPSPAVGGQGTPMHGLEAPANIPRFVVQKPPDGGVDPRWADHIDASLLRARPQAALLAFRAEPRDPNWAPRREERIRDVRGKDLARYPGAQLLTVECRQVSCETVFDVPADRFAEIFRNRVRVGTITDRVLSVPSPDHEGYTRVVEISGVHPDNRDDQFFENFTAEQSTRPPRRSR
jgi:hypothetical protein